MVYDEYKMKLKSIKLKKEARSHHRHIEHMGGTTFKAFLDVKDISNWRTFQRNEDHSWYSSSQKATKYPSATSNREIYR